MFLPEVTYRRLPMTLAPVVMPMSCLIEPRYSTLEDITASPSGGSGGSATAVAGVARHTEVRRSARRTLMPATTHRKSVSCARLRDRRRLRGRAHDTPQERLDGPAHTLRVVGERPVAAFGEDLDLRGRERLALALGLRDRDVRVVRAPDHQRGPVDQPQRVGMATPRGGWVVGRPVQAQDRALGARVGLVVH